MDDEKVTGACDNSSPDWGDKWHGYKLALDRVNDLARLWHAENRDPRHLMLALLHGAGRLTAILGVPYEVTASAFLEMYQNIQKGIDEREAPSTEACERGGADGKGS